MLNNGVEESWFGGLEQALPIEAFSLIEKYEHDPFPQKVNLSVGGEPKSESHLYFCLYFTPNFEHRFNSYSNRKANINYKYSP